MTFRKVGGAKEEALCSRVSATPEESTREAGEGKVCLIEGTQGQDCLRIPS